MEFNPSKLRQRPRLEHASFQFGIEEEYFVCERDTLQPAMRTPDDLFEYRDARIGTRLNREMLQAQIEVGTRPHVSCSAARDELIALRGAAAEAASRHGLAIIAAGTHPTADWRQSVHSPKPRYDDLIEGLQIVGRRNMLCGLHVHVEVCDPGIRIDLMRRITPYIPLLLALSTSSPFWQGEYTGLKGYRLTAYDELPRTGIPELFRSEHEYDAYVQALVASGAIPDASHIWWSVRPSPKYETLELRAPDCCTRLDDAIAIAALYRSLLRFLCRYPEVNADLDCVDRAVAVENKWQAQRHGIEASFSSSAGAVTATEMLDDVVKQVSADAEALGCLDEIFGCRRIVRAGTSADEQLRRFFRAEAGAEPGGFTPVLDWLASTTLAPC
jgi:carboxylate-amine ligase